MTSSVDATRKKALDARKSMATGPIERATPTVREGFHQYLCIDDPVRVQIMKDLGYTHRLDEKGKNLAVQTRGSEKYWLMELPLDLWEDAQKHKINKANERLDGVLSDQTMKTLGYKNIKNETSLGSEEY